MPPGGRGELIVTSDGTVYDADTMKRTEVIERIALLSAWEEQMQFIQNWRNDVEQLQQKQAQLEGQIAEKVKPLQAERDALTDRFTSGENLTSEEWRRYRELGAEVRRLNGIVEMSQAPVDQMGNFLLTREEGAAWLDEIASKVDQGVTFPP